MSLDLFNLNVIAYAAIEIKPMASVLNAMATIQSSPSPIEIADKWQTRLFVASAIFAVVAALIGAGLGVLLWKANNKYQDAVMADANARISEAKEGASKADERAAVADESAGKANSEAGRANERAGELELKAQELAQQNLELRSGMSSIEKAAADAKAA